MTLVLYGRKNCRGSSVRITRDYPDLRDTSLNYRVSSAELTNRDDRALLFTDRHYRGNVLFRSGRKKIDDIGDRSEGGKSGFNNCVKSVRTSPFAVHVKYHFVYKDGALPGTHTGLPGIATIVDHIDELHRVAADIWRPYFIRLERYQTIEPIKSAKYFEIEVDRSEYGELRADNVASFGNHCVNVVVVWDITSQSTADIGGWSYNQDHQVTRLVLLKLRSRSNRQLLINGRTLAHEIGHTFGLQHPRGYADQTNLMTQSVSLANNSQTTAIRLNQAQIEHAHTNLALNDVHRTLLRVE